MNKVNEAGYNEAPKFGPSEGNPPKNIYTQQVDFSNPNADKITSGTTNKPLENKQPMSMFNKKYDLKDKEVDVSLPGSELSDIDSLKYFFEKYLFSVERGKPNQNGATILKMWIDIIQQKHLKNENGK